MYNTEFLQGSRDPACYIENITKTTRALQTRRPLPRTKTCSGLSQQYVAASLYDELQATAFDTTSQRNKLIVVKKTQKLPKICASREKSCLARLLIESYINIIPCRASNMQVAKYNKPYNNIATHLTLMAIFSSL